MPSEYVQRSFKPLRPFASQAGCVAVCAEERGKGKAPSRNGFGGRATADSDVVSSFGDPAEEEVVRPPLCTTSPPEASGVRAVSVIREREWSGMMQWGEGEARIQSPRSSRPGAREHTQLMRACS